LVGDIASRLYVAGGTPILTEIPEIFGAEHMLLAQAATPSLSSEAAALIDGFKQYFVRHGQPVHENPSPGNKAGGITTLEEKSLGAVQKAGAARLTQVLHYGERVRCSGLALLEAPGNDAVSSTALAAAGATMILFTTGRGTPMGFPVPVIKIASNSDLAERKPHWIDFDAGRLLTGTTRSDLESDLLATVMAVASGEQTRAELNGEREIAIWKQGVTV
jgi:altronate hydrolase